MLFEKKTARYTGLSGFLLIIFFGSLNIFSQNQENKNADKMKNFINFSLSQVKTVGNHSYAPLSVLPPEFNSKEFVLNLLDAFENKNPKLKITNWKFDFLLVSGINLRGDERSSDGYKFYNYIGKADVNRIGIWIDHELKK